MKGEKFFQGYLVNADYNAERKGDYALRDTVAEAWEPTSEPESACGNIAADLAFNVKTRKATFEERGADHGETSVPIFQVMPSALLLYRLGCTFPVRVDMNPDGYKVVWQVWLEHKATGVKFGFGEWKGGVTLHSVYSNYKQIPAKVKKDLLRLWDYLTSDKCAHPYDRVTAGSVA